MSEQPTSRRQFLRQSAIATPAATFIGCSLGQRAAVMAAKVDRSITVKTPPTVMAEGTKTTRDYYEPVVLQETGRGEIPMILFFVRRNLG